MKRADAGFTLLEVIVALAILSLAVVAAIQGFAQGLRLLKLAGDHQRAMLLADEKAREVVDPEEGREPGRGPRPTSRPRGDLESGPRLDLPVPRVPGSGARFGAPLPRHRVAPRVRHPDAAVSAADSGGLHGRRAGDGE